MFNVHNIVLNKKGGMFYVHILLLNVNYFSYTKTSFINFDRFELAIIKFSIKIIYKFRFIIMIVPRINYVIQEKYVLHIHMNRSIFKFIHMNSHIPAKIRSTEIKEIHSIFEYCKPTSICNNFIS